MRERIRRALTKRVEIPISKGRRKVKVKKIPPSERLVLGIYFGIVALALLTIIECLHMIFLGSFNSEVFAGITLVIGTILGTFFGVKG